MFRYFSKKSSFLMLFATLFIFIQAFEGIVESDFIAAINLRVALANTQPLDAQFILINNPENIRALYDLGTLNLSLILVGIITAAMIIGVFGVILSSKAVSIYIANLRYQTYKKIQSFSFQDIDHFSPNSLITRTTTDCEIASISFSFASKFLTSGIFSFVFGLVKSIIQYRQYAIVYAVMLPVLLVLLVGIVSFAIPYFKQSQKNTDAINKEVRETILGVRVVKAYNLEEKQKDKFEVANQGLSATSIKAFTIVGCLMPIIQGIVSGTMIFVYFIGFKSGRFSEIVPFISILMQVLFGFIISIVTFVQVSRAIPSIKRIQEINNFESSLKFNDESTHKITKGSIEFVNVTHSFTGNVEHAILSGVNLKIKSKDRIGIIGGTGSGKSTLINLIARLFDPTQGEVLIDGINVKDYSFSEINSNVSIAMQPATLFSGTIKSNIALGLPDDMNEEELVNKVEEVAKAAEAWEFITKKENGIYSIVEQRGRNFSGGQKQRISIARTIAKPAKILIFDDATSALDTVTERKVQANIRKHNDATTIIVAQRISSVEELDKIIVVDKGQIVGFDNHKNLLKNNDTYRSIAASQLGTEELNVILKEMGARQIEKRSE